MRTELLTDRVILAGKTAGAMQVKPAKNVRNFDFISLDEAV